MSSPNDTPGHAPPQQRREASKVVPKVDNTEGRIRSDFVRNATIVGDHAETYFELNRRQAGLNRLREAAGPFPSAEVRADLGAIQKLYDADRARLNARQPLLDAEAREVLRAGLVPFDVGSGVANIATGKGKLRDLLSTVSVLPFGAIIRRTGGSFSLAARSPS